MPSPILSVICNENNKNVIRNVYQFEWTPENIEKLAQKALQFPNLYGHEIKDSSDITRLFLNIDKDSITPRGLFYVVDDFIGLFYLTDFSYMYADALAHYTFFDRRHHGRIPLVKELMKYVFKEYHFNRLSVEVPLYTSPQTRHFVSRCGFTLEGKRRKGIKFKDDYFDVLLFGILKSEVL